MPPGQDIHWNRCKLPGSAAIVRLLPCSHPGPTIVSLWPPRLAPTATTEGLIVQGHARPRRHCMAPITLAGGPAALARSRCWQLMVRDRTQATTHGLRRYEPTARSEGAASGPGVLAKSRTCRTHRATRHEPHTMLPTLEKGEGPAKASWPLCPGPMPPCAPRRAGAARSSPWPARQGDGTPASAAPARGARHDGQRQRAPRTRDRRR